jgi:predicted transcriptional regulator
MRDETIDAVAQSAVVVQLLERPDGLSLVALIASIVDVDAERVVRAADSLHEAGIVRRDGNTVYPTPALERMDAIGMVGI